MKLHVFDFDKTLTNEDTLFGFYRQVNEQNFLFYIKRLILLFFAILYKINLISNDGLKRVGVKLFLYGKSRTEIQNASKLYVKKIKLNKIYFNQFLSLKREQRIIISASFEEYLNFIFPDENVIGSRLLFEKDEVFGLDRNMYGENKRDFFVNRGINSIDSFYTDSYSDLPLMKMSEKIFYIENETMKKINLNKKQK